MREFFELIGLFFKVKWFLFYEERKVSQLFYPAMPAFEKVDVALKKAYRFSNPYRMTKLYGETPLTTLNLIAEECRLSKNDHLIELGCGRGRGCLFLHHLVGCKVTGIDLLPQFIEKAKKLGSKVTFLCGDMIQSDLSKATVIYLYGTCLEDESIEQLIQKFRELKIGTKIITVSYPLSDYAQDFITAKQFTASFPWGEGEIYLNYKSPLSSA